MKRRKLLNTLALMPLALLSVSCEKKEFSRATIIAGKVIDQDGNPLEGASFSFYGEGDKFLSGIPTFSINALSDATGKFHFSQHIPKKTNLIWLFLGSNDIVRPAFAESSEPNYTAYFEKDGNYELLIGGAFGISREQWGKTTMFNFKYEKI